MTRHPRPFRTAWRHAGWLQHGHVAYRFFLFTGIALVVYHAVFPALGIVLMGIEMWFLSRVPLQENCWNG